jgi:hypothetical protein
MNTLTHAIYDDPELAQQAIQQLEAIGIARGALLLVTSAMANSAEGRAHMGSFADSGAHMHDAARDHVGGFADSGAHMHDAARDRVGSFASDAPANQSAELVDDLVRAGLSQADAQTAAPRLGMGAALLLVRAEGEPAARAAAILQSAH